MIDYARYRDVRFEERLRHEVRLPRATSSRDDPSCELRIALDDRFDIAALRGLRAILADAGDVRHLRLDFAGVRLLDAAALHLLVDDLVGIEARGASVTVVRLPPGVAARLVHHPLRRYAVGMDERTGETADESWLADDQLFTDPDRDFPGFVPSDR